MIGVVGYEKLLSKKTTDAQMSGGNEPYRFYDSYEALLQDKDDIEILISTGTPREEVLKELSGLKWIFSYSAGVNSFPLQMLKKRGIILTNTSGLHKTNIAEQVLGSMTMFSRNLIQAMSDKSIKAWNFYRVDELIGKKLLIIGTGHVGTEIARKAKAFDMEVHGVRFRDRAEKTEYFDEVCNVRDLLEVLPGKDYVCLIVPATKETGGLMGEKEFKAMDSSAVFINVGRGDTVAEAELVEALSSGQIRGAILDVFEVEPLPKESPLWEMPNVILTPHIAGPTPYYAERAFAMFIENLSRYRRGEELNNRIDYDRGY